jgi:transposase
MPMNMQYERAFGVDHLTEENLSRMHPGRTRSGKPSFPYRDMGQQGKARLAGRLCKGALVLMEAGTALFSLARFLLENTEAEVVVFNPAKLYNIFNSTLKTDKTDSEKIARIARYMSREEWPIVAIPTREEQAERSAVSLEVFLAQEITTLVNRLNALFNSMGPSLHQDGGDKADLGQQAAVRGCSCHGTGDHALRPDRANVWPLPTIT